MSQQDDPLPNFYNGTGLAKTPFESLNAQFRLTEMQFNQLNQWLLEVEKEAAVKQLADPQSKGTRLPDGPLPYYGTLAGGVHFTFTPVGLGVCISATEEITGKTIVLTDFSDW